VNAVGTGRSKMADIVMDVGTITYDFYFPADPRTINLFCGINLVSGQRTDYPSFEIWAYQDAYAPRLMYHYNAKAAGATVEDLYNSTVLGGL
jgi:hypothetical protein